MDQYAHALLPMAGFAETAGTFVNAAGEWQAFDAAVLPFGEAKPGWKVLRVLGNTLGLSGFGFDGIEEVQTEIRGAMGNAKPDNRFNRMALQLAVPRRGTGCRYACEWRARYHRAGVHAPARPLGAPGRGPAAHRGRGRR